MIVLFSKFVTETKRLRVMKFFNQFHKESTERKWKKIEEMKKAPISPKDFAEYMKKNLETAKQMEAASK